MDQGCHRPSWRNQGESHGNGSPYHGINRYTSCPMCHLEPIVCTDFYYATAGEFGVLSNVLLRSNHHNRWLSNVHHRSCNTTVSHPARCVALGIDTVQSVDELDVRARPSSMNSIVRSALLSPGASPCSLHPPFCSISRPNAFDLPAPPPPLIHGPSLQSWGAAQRRQ